MRFFTTLLCSLTLGLALPNCAQKSVSAAQQAPATKDYHLRQGGGPVLTFERTACMGKCPTYTMQVYADGRVMYEGRRYVPLMGQRDLKLPAATVADMLRKAQEAQFDQFEDRYAAYTTDLPSTIIGIQQPNGLLKKVVIIEGAPENVNKLVASLGTQLDQLAKVGGATE
ncbi:DUF6438 domain-containing protein [Hymenobacter sp. IS2118]|uniref:DUF6438 domain-containing protein n=1 Tax=Hymenobacter sp. IS2118 TaxID=1505605 RepID=UPI0005547B32|nr:DUF6438 domain-containing protein [Hymenobacter sp. IS2118]